MRRPILLIAALAVVAASCSSGTDTASPPPDPSSTTAAAQTTPDVSTTATAPESTLPKTEAPTETTVPIEGPPAPDFTMTLDDGSEFTLSAEQKPVYLVFWAEW